MSSDTRERILAVASELFTDQGYEATSLREISARLDITKAALYYHFDSKDAIMRALLEPFDVLIEELMARLEEAHDLESWCDGLLWVVGKITDYLDFFRLIEHNRHIIVTMLDDLKHTHAHADMHARVEAAAHAAAASVGEEIRMLAALGAVTGFDDWAPTLLKNTDPDVMQRELSDAVRDILGLPRTRRARRTPPRVPAAL
jgi:AcrR family transcriptional regulator